jgi:hypothetical protein
MFGMFPMVFLFKTFLRPPDLESTGGLCVHRSATELWWCHCFMSVEVIGGTFGDASCLLTLLTS